jgi:hypothetical protein
VTFLREPELTRFRHLRQRRQPDGTWRIEGKGDGRVEWQIVQAGFASWKAAFDETLRGLGYDPGTVQF